MTDTTPPPGPVYTAEDRADVTAAAGHITHTLADIAHHELGDLSEGWSLHGDDVPAEIARVRARADELAEAVRQARADLRRIEITGAVRGAWETAMAAGGIVIAPEQAEVVAEIHEAEEDEEDGMMPDAGVLSSYLSHLFGSGIGDADAAHEATDRVAAVLHRAVYSPVARVRMLREVVTDSGRTFEVGEVVEVRHVERDPWTWETADLDGVHRIPSEAAEIHTGRTA